MSYFIHDPDEWETVVKSETLGEMFGVPVSSFSTMERRRTPEEIARIKAEKRRAHEERVLAEADTIRARRAGAG